MIYGNFKYGAGYVYREQTRTLWPGALPSKFLQEGFSDLTPDLVLRTKMDSPISKIRRLYTKAVRTISGKITLTIPQKEILHDFYRAMGDQIFKFPEPYTGILVSVRFLDKPGEEFVQDAVYVNVLLKLGILP
jgi:hypothetical protein